MSRYALVVGVSEYRKDRTLKNLPAAATDIAEVSRVLTERGDFEVQALPNPTSQQLTRALEELFADRAAGDTVLVYFSGHGLTDQDRDRLYLAGTDTEEAHLDSSAVNSSLLGQFARTTSASAKIILLDCCFAGIAGNGLRARNGSRVKLKRLNANGTVILTATDRTSPSFEDTKSPGRPAYFTEAVVEALSGKARDADGDGWISVQDLAEYVQSAEKLTDLQTPQLYADGVTGGLRLVRADAVPAQDPADVPTMVCGVPQPEPNQAPDAPLDHTAWRHLIEYYVACLKREAGMGAWLFVHEPAKYCAWPGRQETMLSGSGQPFKPGPDVLDFLAAHDRPNDTFHYGYPVVVSADGKDPVFAPLITARFVHFDSDHYILDSVTLNEAVLTELGLEPPEVAQLTGRFAANFSYTNPKHLKTQIDEVIKVLGLATPEEPNPFRLSPHLRTSPLVNGVQNLAIVYLADDSPNAIKALLKDLQERMIQKIPQLKHTALAALAQDPAGPIPTYDTLVAPGPLNESQEAVVHSAMTRRLTVATGPPGTGKTALVTALTATAIANGQTILVGSTNNEAVNGVHDKANKIADGLMIRTGKRAFKDAEPQRLGELLRNATLPADTRTAAARVRHVQQAADEVRSTLDRRRELETELLDVYQRLAVLREAAPESARSFLTVDSKALMNAAVRARRSLHRWPNGLFARFVLSRRLGLRTTADRQAATELFEEELTRRQYVAVLTGERAEDDTWRHLKELLGQRQHESGDVIKARINRMIQAGRGIIEQRIANLRAGESSWKGFKDLLRALPGWAVNGHSGSALPPEPGLFDLVVIDEAAQCPTPIVISLLMRAKRALIIGDPHQIPPVVKLNRTDDDLLRRRHKLGKQWMENRKLGYVGGSIYDACAVAAGEVALLDEHFRCDPAIVDVPNQVMYGGKLAVLTSVRNLAVPATAEEPAVQIIDHPGRVLDKVNGSEAARVIELVQELVARHPGKSIGIVSPFRAQVNHLLRRVPKNDPPIKVGTAHTFQGDECDIIVLSPVASEGVKASTANWAAGQANLWNVAVTRAKSRLYVVCDKAWWSGQTSLLAELINNVDAPPTDERVEQLVERLHFKLLDLGVDAKVDQLVNGQKVHLVVPGGARERAVVVDLDTSGSGHRYRQLLAKLDLIADAGFEPVRVPAWRCLAEPEVVAAELTRTD